MNTPDALSSDASSGSPVVKYVRMSPSASAALSVKPHVLPSSTDLSPIGSITGAVSISTVALVTLYGAAFEFASLITTFDRFNSVTPVLLPEVEVPEIGFDVAVV